jgi:cathepsin L
MNMNKNRLVAIAAAASLLGARVSAADKGKVDFDQGVSAADVLAQLQDQPSVASPASQPEKTFRTESTTRAHAKGFKKHEGRKRDYKKASDLGPRVSAALPNTLDLRPNLTQIEDQASCGGCWAFSLTATNRDGHAIDGSDPGRLSQEWLIEHAKEADGCSGGDFDAADNLVAPKGQPSWDKCQYEEGSGKCSARLKPAANSSISGWHMLGDAANGPSVRDIETEIAASGKPVSIAVAAAAGLWEKYSGGVYNGCTAGPLDHMINIVGWDNEGASFDANGNLPPGTGVWILRNSWGTSWGESGYMRTKMTDASGARCNGVAAEAAYFDF